MKNEIEEVKIEGVRRLREYCRKYKMKKLWLI